MSLLSPLPQTVSIVHHTSGAGDAYGNAARTAGTPVSVAARLEQLTSTETTLGQDTVLDRWRLFLPVGTVIGAGDDVTEGGRTFRVDGTPEQVYGPAAAHHIEAVLVYTGD